MKKNFKTVDDLLKGEKMSCNYDSDMTVEERYVELDSLDHFLGTTEMTNENPASIPDYIFFSSFPGLTHRQVYKLLDHLGCNSVINGWSQEMYEYGYVFRHLYKVRSIQWDSTITKQITYVTPVGRTYFKQLLELACRDILAQ